MPRALPSALLVALLCVLSGPALSGTANAVPAVNRAAAGAEAQRVAGSLSTDQFESRLLARTNHRRAAHGCRPVQLNPALVLAARRHSAAMSGRTTLTHRLAGEPGLVVRVVSAGYTPWRLLAENLAWGQAGPRGVFRAWVQSPGHRANLDNCRLRDIGFGVVYRSGRPWVTADFGRH